MTKTQIVTVEHGQLQGRVVDGPSGKTFYCFQGIPYAKPPLGSLRFKAPQAPEPWEGVRDATSEANISPQVDHTLAGVIVGDEDCLYLNVYTPKLDGEPLPVLFWIHGGAFRWGSGSSCLYGGDYLVEKDVIVVTINYRLGPLGFLCLNTPEVPGNAGLKDQIQALRWVKKNIHNFGGDPGNITVFGESAGGVSTAILTASPMSKNLISKAIMQSGCAVCKWSFQENPVRCAKSLASHLGCDSEDVDKILEFLTTVPTRTLVEVYEKINQVGSSDPDQPEFKCVIEKEFPGVEPVVTESYLDILTSGRVANIPVMVGCCSMEMGIDIKADDLQAYIPEDLMIEKNSPESLEIAAKLQELYFNGKPMSPENMYEQFQLLSDKAFTIDARRFVKYLIQVVKKPVYYYRFDYVGELNLSLTIFNQLSLKYAVHMDDLGYLFKNDFQKDAKPTPQDIKTRERMLRLWTNFARTGNPTPDDSDYLTTTWLPVTKDKFYYLNIGTELYLGINPDEEKMEFWDDVYKKHFKLWKQPKANTSEAPKKAVVQNSNGAPKNVIRANDPIEDDLPKNIGVNKFVNFYESLGEKK